MKNRGAILVLFLIAAGLAAAIGAIWHQHRQTHQALSLWGHAVAQRISRAENVELIELPGRDSADGGSATGTLQPGRVTDVSHARGLVHFRRSLLQDANFDWDTAIPAVSAGNWDYAVRFSDDEGNVMVMFDLDRGMVANRAPGCGAALLTERTSQGLRQFFDETLAQTAR